MIWWFLHFFLFLFPQNLVKLCYNAELADKITIFQTWQIIYSQLVFFFFYPVKNMYAKLIDFFCLFLNHFSKYLPKFWISLKTEFGKMHWNTKKWKIKSQNKQVFHLKYEITIMPINLIKCSTLRPIHLNVCMSHPKRKLINLTRTIERDEWNISLFTPVGNTLLTKYYKRNFIASNVYLGGVNKMESIVLWRLILGYAMQVLLLTQAFERGFKNLI